MLVFIVNTLFKNGKSKESLHYAAILHTAMEEHQKFLYGKYLFFHYNALVINYSKLDKDKAIAILQEMKANERIRSTPFYEMFVYLNLAVLYFDKAEFGQSIRQLSRLYLLDAYRDADRSLQFKIAIAELMIRYELQDEELLERKLREAKRISATSSPNASIRVKSRCSTSCNACSKAKTCTKTKCSKTNPGTPGPDTRNRRRGDPAVWELAEE